MRNERERLLDILEAIERIEKYAEEGKDAFESNELIQTWVIHHITIIGEACRSLPMNFRQIMQLFPGRISSVCGISLSIIILELMWMQFGLWLSMTFLS
jgi:hypothetical protein